MPSPGNANVKALVYIDAFIPDVGQALVELTAGSCLEPKSAFNAAPPPGALWTCTFARRRTRRIPGFGECFATGVIRRQPPCSPPSNGPPR